MKTFTEYFPKYPKSDELYELVRLSMVKSTLVNKAQRKVKVWLTTQQYMDASVCVRIAANIKEAYALADVTVRCCCAGAQKSTLADFLQEAKEDNAALGAYLAGEARWEDGVVCVPVRITGAAVLERVGMVKKLQDYFNFKYDATAAVRFVEEEQASENIEEYIAEALSPAKAISVVMEDERSARVKVAADQLSLAIGREGQNAKLVARLTGCKIDIKAD
jgi:hypothetical protein